MSKLFKIFIILFAIFIILLNCNYTFADVDMNLSSNTSNTSNISNTSNTANMTNTTNTASTNSTPNTTTTFSSVGTSSFDLQLNNILNVALIVVGVLLILLGIAILIRLKN